MRASRVTLLLLLLHPRRRVVVKSVGEHGVYCEGDTRRDFQVVVATIQRRRGRGDDALRLMSRAR
jgi:hypothetical protein